MTYLITIISCISLFVLFIYQILRDRSLPGLTTAVATMVLLVREIADQLALGMVAPFHFRWYGMLAEAFLPFSFLLLSLTLSRRTTLKEIPGRWWIVLAGSLVFPAMILVSTPTHLFYAPDLSVERVLFLTDRGYWFYLGIMGCLILSLMNLESTFSSSSGSQRWRLKFTFLGLITILAVEILYSSQALLYRSINMNLLPVREVIFLLATMMILYSKAFRGNNIRLQVSRPVFYRSLSLIAVGLYLLLLGGLGEGLKYTGIDLKWPITVLFGFLFGIALFVIIFSERVRRKVKVTVNKHFYPLKHDYREVWLRFTETLSRCQNREDLEDVILQTYRDIFGLRSAALYRFYPSKGGFFLSRGSSMPETDRGLSLSSKIIGYFLETGRVFDPSTGEYNPTADERVFLQASGAELLVPLVSDGKVEAVVALGKQLIQDRLTYEDYDMMRTLAKQSALALKNLRLREELSEAQQVTAVAKVSSFIVHDLKNMASTLSLTLENAEQFISEPEFQKDLLQTLKHHTERMKTLISRLRRIPERPKMKRQPTELQALINEVLKELPVHLNGKKLLIKGDSVSAEVDREEMKRVLLNLILNAIEATPENEGTITIETLRGNGTATVKISDNGVGMSEEFIRNRLFRPFQSTKKKGLGVGLYQCKVIIEAHGGRIEVRSALQKGTEFAIYLPLVTKEEKEATPVAEV